MIDDTEFFGQDLPAEATKKSANQEESTHGRRRRRSSRAGRQMKRETIASKSNKKQKANESVKTFKVDIATAISAASELEHGDLNAFTGVVEALQQCNAAQVKRIIRALAGLLA